MGDGTKENPYTREDVLRMIEEHGGKAEGLDLSWKVFEEDIDLSKLDLKGIVLNDSHLEGVDLRDAHLKEAYLKDAHLERTILWEAHLEEAILWGAHLEEAGLEDAHLEGAMLRGAHLEEAGLEGAHLEEADLELAHLEEALLEGAHLEGAGLVLAHLEGAMLWEAHLEEAGLEGAHLEGADLEGATFSVDTKLEDADWGNYILMEEKNGEFDQAAATYRRLKQWHTNAGMYDTAGKFFFREMTARRKALEWWPNPLNRAFSKLISILCGYGEKPKRVVVSAIVIIFGLAMAYHLWGSFTANASSFWDKLYYSAVSFTAVGYGNWAPQPTDWARGVGVAEAFLGVFMMALFLVTFTRKMTR